MNTTQATTFPDDCTNAELLQAARSQLKLEFPDLLEADIENLCGQRAVAILDVQYGRNTAHTG